MDKRYTLDENQLFNEAVKAFGKHEDQQARVLFEQVIALKGARALEAEHYLLRIRDRGNISCVRCGTEFIREASFCPSCGSPQRLVEIISGCELEGVDEGSVRVRSAGDASDSRKPEIPIFSGWKGEGKAASPTEAVIRRTPHMDISQAASNDITGGRLPEVDGRASGERISGIRPTVEPGVSLTVSIYADKDMPRPGEQTEEIVFRALPEQNSFKVEVRLLATGHFRVESDPVDSILIERGKPRSIPAEFKVRVRSKNELVERKAEATVAGITAVFAYNGRASGRITRIIQIGKDEIREDAPGPEKLKRATLLLDAMAQPAELSVVILAAPANDGRQYWCTVRTPFLPEYSQGVTEEWNLPDITSKLVTGFMKGFTDKKRTERNELVYSLKGAGDRLFKASPKVFQEVFWKLVDAGKLPRSISIVSEEPFIPWELMIPIRKVNGVKEARDPLGVEFLIGRWTSDGGTAARQKIPVSDCCVVAPVYVGGKSLKHSTTEAEFVLKRFPGKRIDPADFNSVDIGLQTQWSLVHFICHGSDGGAGKQVILLEKNTFIDSVLLLGMEEVEKVFSKNRPFVFLNACEVGGQAPALLGVGGFAQSFIEIGASAVIAPLWSVKDDIAHEVATFFYDAVLNNPGKPFAEILSEIRKKAYDTDGAEDTYAAYCFYGDALACRS